MSLHRATLNSREGLKILVPLDGSDVAVKALEYARLFPLARVSLLHVTPQDRRIQPSLTDSEKQRWAEMAMPGLERVQLELQKAGIESGFELRSGDVASEIITSAEHCDLIVMTTSGRGSAGRVIFGSVADRVSRSSTTPTLLIRGNLVASEMKLPTRVLVPVDGSKRAEAAIAMAADLATKAGIPIKLVRAVDLEDVLNTLHRARAQASVPTQASAMADETYDAAWKETIDQASGYLERLAGPLRKAGLQVSVEILHGTPVFMLLAEIDESDLVVMTSHGQGGYQRWLLGSVAEKLIREAKSPVLLVPSRDKIPATRDTLTK